MSSLSDTGASLNPASHEANVLVFGKEFPLPTDLYIPPDALQIILQQFSGPMDLLLYLIRKQNLDLLDIPIFRIAEQYNAYIDMMLKNNINLASEYLVMATTLARIKSRLLLPMPPTLAEDGEEPDPRAELVNRLLEYEYFNQAARVLEEAPKIGQDLFEVNGSISPETPLEIPLPIVKLEDLIKALTQALERQKRLQHYQVGLVTIDIHNRIYEIYNRLESGYCAFRELLNPKEGSLGVVVNFFSTLCLANAEAIELTQENSLGEIHITRTQKYNSIRDLRKVLNGSADLESLLSI